MKLWYKLNFGNLEFGDITYVYCFYCSKSGRIVRNMKPMEVVLIESSGGYHNGKRFIALEQPTKELNKQAENFNKLLSQVSSGKDEILCADTKEKAQEEYNLLVDKNLEQLEQQILKIQKVTDKLRKLKE